ncbi:MAG: YlmC/YmxH family sporulation protein [Anaerovoracaceae bacterium]|nr:YlmC/YmxH family sporulation protein [Anaerovoracaceae bacterium]
MMISTDKLKNKEVINISDGRSLGFVCDIEVDLDRGVIDGIVIPPARGFMGLFSKKEGDMVIKWDKVRTVGDDVILVDMESFD